MRVRLGLGEEITTQPSKSTCRAFLVGPCRLTEIVNAFHCLTYHSFQHVHISGWIATWLQGLLQVKGRAREPCLQV